MLWIALYLPELPLEALARAAREDLPLVLVDGPAQRQRVVAMTESARDEGVQPGMALAAAQALCARLKVVARDTGREEAALDGLAAWAGQFSPVVSLEEGGLLLEVEGSLALFGSLMSLLAKLRRGVRELGFTAVPAVAPTALAASWLARARHAQPGLRSCHDPAHLMERLSPLPLAALGWPEASLEKLASLGVRKLGQCLALPRDGFARRFGPERAAELDKALGLLPDPRPLFTPPEAFSSLLELPAEADKVEALLFPLRRLLLELEGFLRGRGAGVQKLELLANHVGRGRTRVLLGLAVPERDAARLLSLLKERLGRVELPGPVVALCLLADDLQAFEGDSHGLFPSGAGRSRPWQQLQERLHARLGAGRVHVLAAREDHRPELAWRAVPALESRAVAAPQLMPAGQRPVWLLSDPRPLSGRDDRPEYHGPLTLLQGPERIESGWWDGRPAGRDYYVARSRRGELLWVYRDHHNQPGQPGWFLHGIFA